MVPVHVTQVPTDKNETKLAFIGFAYFGARYRSGIEAATHDYRPVGSGVHTRPDQIPSNRPNQIKTGAADHSSCKSALNPPSGAMAPESSSTVTCRMFALKVDGGTQASLKGTFA